MKRQKQHSQQKITAKRKNKCCYFISLKPIYKTPLNKYDFNNYDCNIPYSETSEYFNYGFDSASMTIYNKLTNKFVNRENNRKEQLSYDPLNWNLLKLNDSVPIDLGGFGPILDKKGIQMDLNTYFDEDLIIKELVYRCMQITALHQRQTIKQDYGMIEFIRSLYRQFTDQQNNLTYFFHKLEKYLDQKYNQTIFEEKEKEFHQIKKKQNEEIQSGESNKEEQNIYDFIFQKIRHANQYQMSSQNKNDSTNKNNQRQYSYENQYSKDFYNSDSQYDKKRKSQKSNKRHRNRKNRSHSKDSEREKERKHRHKHISGNKKLKKHKHHHKKYKKDEQKWRKQTK